MSGFTNSWTQSTLSVSNHQLTCFTLNNSVGTYLIFMRLPDGGTSGSGFSRYNRQSLQKLWQGTISTITAVDGSNSYTSVDLVSTLATLMQLYQPDQIRTQNYIGSYGNGDHSDHLTTAYLANSAHQQYSPTHTFAGYDGYPMSSQPANVSVRNADQKQTAFLTYAQYDPLVCQTATQCAGTNYGSWLVRQYITASQGQATPVPSHNTNYRTYSLGGQYCTTGTLTASSQNVSTNQLAVKAVDGYTDGYPSGDYTHEWATTSQGAGAWLNIAWASPHTISRVILYDRPNLNDQVTAGTLTFSDGSSVSTGLLNNDRSAVTLDFPSRTVNSLRLNITTVSGTTLNVGLAEIQVYELAQAGTPTPSSTPLSTSSPTLSPTPSSPTPSRTPTAPAATPNQHSPRAILLHPALHPHPQSLEHLIRHLRL